MRGSTKRGRPRGSRRGGPVGGKARSMMLLHPTSVTSKALPTSTTTTVSVANDSTTTNSANAQNGELFIIFTK